MPPSRPARVPAMDTEDLVQTLLARGRVSMDRQDYGSAADYFGLAERLAEGSDSLPSLLLNRAVRKLVPRWHFAMLNDVERNQAYHDAIMASVRPGDLVLDIGTGSGLLALLAARAGAAQVVTCEVEPLIATVAEQIVRANGFDTRITVVNKASTDLRLGVDLPRRADVLVTEIFDCALLGENALPTLEHAREELLVAEPRIVPGRGRLWGQLVSSDRLRSHNHVSTACGFDVSGFNNLRSMEYFSTYLHNYPHLALTEPFPLLDVDFGADCPPNRELVKALPTVDGDCDAIAIWFELDLGAGVTLSNSPLHPDTHWRQAVQTFAAPLRCEAGIPVPLHVFHDRERVCVGTDREVRTP
ncbi:type II protein arginine methyltransferase [Kutzneria viridogrisea]|nr:50S ribosomal protein L11 methyltransferase [Kutzneria albida]MBA8922847.1 type II protein arginine methyltransferase [Kutzneria viridogrisea]